MEKRTPQRYFALWLSILLFMVSAAAQLPYVQAAEPDVTGITLNQTHLTLTVGDEAYPLIATVLPENANQQVRWITTAPRVAAVDRDGNVTPLAAGTATIIATTVSGGKTAFCTITVQPKPRAVTGLSLDKTSVDLTVGGNTVTLVPRFQPSDATNKGLNWVSTNPSVAKVDESGNITPLGIGTANIVVTTVDGGFTATCLVRVSNVIVTGITLDKPYLTLQEDGSSVTLTATITPANASDKSVNWTSSNTAVASVDSTGTVTPHNTGTAIITASTADGSKKATSTVTVLSKLSDVLIFWDSDSRVTVTWSGTSGRVTAELRQGTELVDSVSTSTRSATFTGLGRRTEYTLWINGQKARTFRISDLVNDDIDNLKVTRESSSSVEITWNGTSGTVRVDLFRDSRRIDSASTRSRSVDFDDLDLTTLYKIYIDGKYAGSFKIGNLNQVRNLEIEKKTATSLSISWTGTTGTVQVELKRNGRSVDDEYTSARKASFSGLSKDTEYDLYIDGSYIRSIRTNQYETPQNLVIHAQTNGSVVLTWSGTEGRVEVSLYRDGVFVERKTTSARRISFTRLNPIHKYDIYIDGEYVKSFKLGDQSFKDVRQHWAKDAIDRLAYHGILNGFTDGTFRPDQTVTREQFVTMLVQAKGYPIQKGSTGFRDVPAQQWSAPFIYTAIKQGIILPAEYGSRFDPRQPASREEMAVMLARAQKLKADASALKFGDNRDIVNKGLVGATVKNDLILGYPNNTFRPKAPLTRAAAAVVIDQIYEP